MKNGLVSLTRQLNGICAGKNEARSVFHQTNRIIPYEKGSHYNIKRLFKHLNIQKCCKNIVDDFLSFHTECSR